MTEETQPYAAYKILKNSAFTVSSNLYGPSSRDIF